jgi:uncharacterized membrane protein YhaH (DUF805 family)
VRSLLLDYFAFDGRLARIPFVKRYFYLNIGFTILFVSSIPLFSNGSAVLWWLGILELVIVTGIFSIGTVSVIVRRLHDLDLSGLHALWVGAALIGAIVLSYQSDFLLFLCLLPFAIWLWLLFCPGTEASNRFGEADA